jgi:small GTP-binding protein
LNLPLQQFSNWIKLSNMDNRSQSALFHVKVILAGDGMVGKSSLLRRYIFDEFNSAHEMTIGMDAHTKLTKVPGLGPVKIQTWDLAGQPQWSVVRDSFYVGSHAVAVVYDVSDLESIKHLPDWIRECRSRVANLPVIIVGNKIDLPRRVPSDKIAKWAREHRYDYIETSPKTNHNVDALFERLGVMGVNFALKSR